MSGEQDNYRTFFEAVPAMMCFVGFDGRILSLNRAWETCTGFCIDDLKGRQWADFVHPDDLENVKAAQRRALDGEPSATVQLRSLCKDGSYKWLLVSGSADKERAVFYTTASDISALKDTESSLRASEHLLRRIVDKAPISMAIVGMDERIEYINRKAEETFGYPNSEIPSMRDWWVKAYPDEKYRAEVVADWMGRVMDGIKRNGEILGNNYRVTCRDGSVKTCFICGVIAADKVFVMFEDVTERKEYERQLRENERNLREILMLSPMPIAVVSIDGPVELMNRKFTETYGYTREDLPTHASIRAVIATADGDKARLTSLLREALERFRATGQQPRPVDGHLRTKNGELRAILSTPVFLSGGRLLSIMLDVTDERAAELALRERESLYRALVETTRTGYVIIDGQGRVADANNEYVRLAGFTDLKQIMGRSVLEWTAPHEKARNAEAVARCVRDGHIYNFEMEYTNPGGGITPVEINATVVSRDGVSRILSVCRDISERRRRNAELQAFNEQLEQRVSERTAALKKANIDLSMEIAQRMDAERASQKLEEELRRAQRMEALGQLAGGIAHDFNNILVAISGYAEFLTKTLPADSPGRSDLAEIMHETERGATLTRQLSTIGRREPLEFAEVDLNAEVQDACRMLERLLGAGVRLESTLAPGLPQICSAAGHVSQLVMNLVLNARDAMPGGGRITVSTGSLDFAGGDGMPVTPAPGKYVYLEVKDEGQGMSPETARQAFEPFYTTKEPGKGTGLGLSVVYSIVKQAGGGIDLKTAPGAGTAVRILLPPCPPARTSPPSRKP